MVDPNEVTEMDGTINVKRIAFLDHGISRVENEQKNKQVFSNF